MIKGTLIKPDGTKVVLIGLSGENMARLMADEPIVFNLSELGLRKQEICIIGGKDEDAIAAHVMATTKQQL